MLERPEFTRNSSGDLTSRQVTNRYEAGTMGDQEVGGSTPSPPTCSIRVCGPGEEMMKKTKKGDASQKTESPSRLIDARIEELNDWRGKTLSRVRSLIRKADPGIVEEWKWGVPVW